MSPIIIGIVSPGIIRFWMGKQRTGIPSTTGR